MMECVKDCKSQASCMQVSLMTIETRIPLTLNILFSGSTHRSTCFVGFKEDQ